jgi:uncharacterized protein (DUF488 family)
VFPSPEDQDRNVTVWTIGHSTRSLDEFLTVLEAHRIEAVVDVRRFPGSRRLPHFGSDVLAHSLEEHGIAYCWLAALGGRRRGNTASRNSAWRNAAFAAYADHIESDEFAAGLAELLTIAAGLRTAIMCAEVLWWRCHRRIIADVLTSLGDDVLHIRDARIVEAHHIAAPARLVDGVLTYEADVAS